MKPLHIFGIIGLSTLWFFIITYPLIFNFSDALITANNIDSDAHQYIWNVWNVKKQLALNQSIFKTNYLFSPFGASMWMHTYTPLMSVFCLLFESNIFGINLFLLLNFIVGAIGAGRLVARFIPNPVFWYLGAMVFAYNPYKMAHLGEHYHLIINAIIPFLLYDFLEVQQRLQQNKSIQSLIPQLILFFGVAFLCDYYQFCYLFLSGILILIIPKTLLWVQKKSKSYTLLKKVIIILLFFLSIHFLIRGFQLLDIDTKSVFYWGGDLLSFLIPPLNSALFSGETLTNIYFSGIYKTPLSTDNVLFVGYFLFISTIVGWFLLRKKKYTLPSNFPHLFTLGIILVLIALPNIRIGGCSTINSPTALMNFIPLVNNLRCPTRIAMILFALFPIISSIIIYYACIAYNVSSTIKNVLVAVLIIVTMIEYFPTSFTLYTKSNVPEYATELSHRPVGQSIIIPCGLRDGMGSNGIFNTPQLFAQTIHEQPMIGGYISRMDKNIKSNYLRDSVITNFFRYSADTSYQLASITLTEKEQFFSTFTPTYIVIEKNYSSTKLEQWIEQLIFPKRFTKERFNNSWLYTIESSYEIK